MRLALSTLVLLFAATLHAAPRSLVVVSPRSPWMLHELEAMHLDLVSYDPASGAAYLTVTAAEERVLVERGYAVATVEPDADAGRERLLAIPDLGLYHTYAETVAELESLQSTYPTLTRLEVLGTSLEGRAIPALKISDTPEVEDPTEPDVLFVGNHHAREFMSVEVPLYIARTLLERYAQSPRIRALVDTREIWIVPMLNPDGHFYQSQTQLRPGWRKNRRPIDGEPIGVDLNRNYSYAWGADEEGSSGDALSETYRGTGPFSEPETQVLRQLVERQRFTVAVSYHSFGRLVLFPWGHTRESVTPDHAVFVAMADSMVRDNGYRPGNAYTGAIYLTNGVWDDFMYGETNAAKPEPTFAFTVELNDANEGGFWPPEDRIEPTCESMWSLNLYVLRVADDVRSSLPPPAPALTALQDVENPRRVHLTWTSPPAGSAAIDRYEVFEIAAASAAAPLASPVRLGPGERGVIAQGVRVPADGSLPLEICGRLDPAWDDVRIEARVAGTDDWRVLPCAGATAATGRANGALWLAGPVPRRAVASALPGALLDLAVRLDSPLDAPRPAWLQARLDVVGLLGETRRVIAVVHDTTYTVQAERAGLFAYGVTAVGIGEQRTDSDIYWFVIPEGTPVDLTAIEFEPASGAATLSFVVGAAPETFEAWVRPLTGTEAPRPLAQEWAGGHYRRVAVVEATSAGRWSLHFALPAARSSVLLRTAAGDRLWGPWVAGALPRLALHAAVPNPFNPETRLRFDSDGTRALTLEILRPDGKRVRRLIAGAVVPAGTHDVAWDGRDDGGRRAAAGVYLATLRAGGETHSQRLVLLP